MSKFSTFTDISMNILYDTGLNDTNNILRLSKHRKSYFGSQTIDRGQNSLKIGQK